ncbi:hypothetical protein [Streptomyces sp. NPDC002067]
MNSEDTTPESTGATRSRRNRVAVVSVAAAVLVAGGGAAYWASAAGGDGPEHRTAGGPPPLVLDGYQGRGQIAAGEPNPQGAAYRPVKALPDGPGAAPVYRPRGGIAPDAVKRLAKALDVAGKVRSEGTTWKVGGPARDGRGPVLTVSKTGSGSWTFSAYGTPGGTNCALPASPGGGADGGASQAPGCPSYRGGPDAATRDDGSGAGAVSQRAAERAVRPVLAALGQSDARLDAHGLSGAVRTVRADPVLGGLPTYGWQSDLQVGADGQVVGGSGQLARPVKGAQYPVLSAERTLARLNSRDGSHTPGDCPSSDAAPESSGGIARCEPAPTRAQQPARVTGAVFGLSVQYVSGGQALVPSWLFEVRQPGAGDGPDAASTVAHPAVQPQYLTHPGDGPAKGSAAPSGQPGAMAAEAYAVSDGGRKLTLHFWGGVCSTYTVRVRESDAAVRTEITGKEKEPGRLCVKSAKEFTRSVTLKAPLDDRKVLDASTGEPVPAQ